MPLPEELLQEEGPLLEGSHLPVLANKAHGPHASRKPDVEVFLLPTLSIPNAEPPEGQDTANLLVILLYLAGQE